jgi:hypothetical protein
MATNIICPTCKRKPAKSRPQENRLHKFFHLLAASVPDTSGEYHPWQWWKVMCKDQWLGYNEFRKANGDLVEQLKSTTELTMDEINEFMEKVERYCAKRGLYLQDGD